MDQTQNIMKPLRKLQILRSLKFMWKLEAACLSLLDKYRKWRYHFCHSTKEDNQEQSGCRPSFPQAGLVSFFANISNIPFIGRRHQFLFACLAFLSIQFNNQQLIFPPDGIHCHFVSWNTTEEQYKPFQAFHMSYPLCFIRFQHLYFLFEPHEIR